MYSLISQNSPHPLSAYPVLIIDAGCNVEKGCLSQVASILKGGRLIKILSLSAVYVSLSKKTIKSVVVSKKKNKVQQSYTTNGYLPSFNKHLEMMKLYYDLMCAEIIFKKANFSIFVVYSNISN